MTINTTDGSKRPLHYMVQPGTRQTNYCKLHEDNDHGFGLSAINPLAWSSEELRFIADHMDRLADYRSRYERGCIPRGVSFEDWDQVTHPVACPVMPT